MLANKKYVKGSLNLFPFFKKLVSQRNLTFIRPDHLLIVKNNGHDHDYHDHDGGVG